MTTDGFNVGDVVFEIGFLQKFVVCGFDMAGMMLGRVIFGQVYPASKWVAKWDYPRFVKANVWSFDMNCEVEVDCEAEA